MLRLPGSMQNTRLACISLLSFELIQGFRHFVLVVLE